MDFFKPSFHIWRKQKNNKSCFEHLDKYTKSFIAILFFTIVSTSLIGQVVINEFIADPGMYDGQGSEWTELYNPSAAPVDLSCWVLTDGEEIIVIPDGTTIPAEGYFVIYNSNFFACANCNWDPAVITNTGATTVWLDVATCNCTNQNAPYSITWDNGGGDGDRIVLFDGSASVVDAVYSGDGSGGAQNLGPGVLAESSSGYTDAQAGGNVDDGNDIIGNSTIGCNLPASNDYSLPALADMEFVGPDKIGCTTSYARTSDGASAWFTDNWPTPGQDNSIPDYLVEYSTDLGDNFQALPSEGIIDICGSTDIQFRTTIYAYNSVYNDNDGDDVTGAGTNFEGGSTRGGSNIDVNGTFTGGDMGGTNDSWLESGYLSTTINGNLTGQTILTSANYTVTDYTEFKLFIKENTQSSGANNITDPKVVSIIFGSGTASECYIQETFELDLRVALTSATHACPSTENGLNTISTMPENAPISSFELYDGDPDTGGLLVTSNTTGSFAITTESNGNTAGPLPNDNGYYYVITPVCGDPIKINPTSCVATPACPILVDNTSCIANSSTPCPEEELYFGIDLQNSTNIPDGAIIEWVNDTDGDGDVYDEPASSVLTTQEIKSVSAIPTNTVPVINEIESNVGSGGEFIEIAAAPGTDLSCYVLTDGDWTIIIPNGTIVPSDGFFLIANNTISSYPGVDLDLSTCNCTDGSGTPPDFTGSGEFIALYNPSLSLIDGIIWRTSSNTANNYPNGQIKTMNYIGAGCSDNGDLTLPDIFPLAPSINDRPDGLSDGPIPGNSPWKFYGTHSSGEPLGLLPDVTGSLTELGAAATELKEATPGTSNAGSSQIAMPACADYFIPFDACGKTLNVKPRISPVYANCTGGSNMPTLTTETFIITCPTASINGETAICNGASTSVTVDLGNYGDCTMAEATIYNEDGDEFTNTTTTIVGNQVTITGVSQPGIYRLDQVMLTGCTGDVCLVDVSGNVTISIADDPDTPVGTQSEVCWEGSGSTVTLNADGGIGCSDGTLVWYEDNAGSPGNEIAVGDMLNYSPISTGAQTLHVSCRNIDTGCESLVSEITFTVDQDPIANSTTLTVCEDGNGNGDFTLTSATDASSSENTGNTDVSNGAAGATVTYHSSQLDATLGQNELMNGNDLSARTIYARVEDTDGCFSTVPITLVVISGPSFMPSLTQPTCTMAGLISVASLTGGTYTYEISTDGTSFSPMAAQAEGIAMGTRSASTYYIRVTRTDISPNCSTTETVNINAVTGCAPACTNPIITTQPTTPTVCSNSTSAVLTVEPSTGYNYQWQFSTDALTWNNVSTSTGGTTATLTIMGAELSNFNAFRVILTDTSDPSCSTTSDGIVLTLSALPTVTVNSPSVCQGQSATVTATPSGGTGSYTYDWTVPSGVTDPGDVISFSTTVPGNYSVEVTDANGCTGTGSGMVTINSNPTITINNPTICSNVTSFNLTSLEPTGQTGGNWTTGGAGGTAVANAAIADPSTGPFTYTYTDGNSCAGNATVSFTINSEPVAGDDGALTVCNADPSEFSFNLFEKLIGSPNTTGTWTETTSGTSSGISIGGGSTGAVNFQNITAGTYEFTYTVTGTNPCPNDMAIVTVTIEDCFDLALIKELTSMGTIRPGDNITFNVTLYNQGVVDAYDVTFTDYFDPAELSFVSATGPAGMQTSNGYTVDFIGVGSSVIIEVTMTVNLAFTGTMIINNAEITAGASMNDGPNAIDIDSTPGSDDGSTPDPKDNDPFDASGGDDYDPAKVIVCPAGCGEFPWSGDVPAPRQEQRPNENSGKEIQQTKQLNKEKQE